ncbi:hypothetical protein NLM24_04800 [Nocardia zapadnayensis]|nr:hypothetical protein [Nocardia zapadnayensis]MCX0270038.1 hypothetical protein [Nocardia zapadnayensis]
MEDDHDAGIPKTAPCWVRAWDRTVDVCTIGTFALEIYRLLQLLAEADTSRTTITLIVARLAVAAVHAVRMRGL